MTNGGCSFKALALIFILCILGIYTAVLCMLALCTTITLFASGKGVLIVGFSTAEVLAAAVVTGAGISEAV